MKYFLKPFGVQGDLQEIPDGLQQDGSVSMETGYGFDYERNPESDPLAKDIERQKMNWLFYAITQALMQSQTVGIFPYITADMNGGNPFPYIKGARCLFGEPDLFVYESLVNNNTALPSDATKWRKVNADEFASVGDVDEVAEALSTHAGQYNAHGARADITPARIAMWDNLGRLRSNAPEDPNHVATRSFVDGLFGQNRLPITSDATIMISQVGNDANDGFSAPVATWDRVRAIMRSIDMRGNTLTIAFAAGTYSFGMQLDAGDYCGASELTIKGAGADYPLKALFQTTSGEHGLLLRALPTPVVLQDVYFTQISGGASGVFIRNRSHLTIKSSLDVIGSNARSYLHIRGSRVRVEPDTKIIYTGAFDYGLIGNDLASFNADTGAIFNCYNNPTFAGSHVSVQASQVMIRGVIFQGSATGRRYEVRNNGVIDTLGAGGNYIPGTIAGAAATGGQYV